MIIETENSEVKRFEGLHLYHGAISNCSMRVRMTLIEKGLPWTSHHIDLKKKENITDEYFSINPKGLVPVLVHDGVVHAESNEIIDYLDTAFPEPPLRDPDSEGEMLGWLKLAGDIHLPAIKPYVYANMIAAKIKKTAEEESKYAELQTNEDLRKFHSKHAGAKAFGDDDIAKSESVLKDCFTKLNDTLADREWVMGGRVTLADISWIPVHFVLLGCGYPFGGYTNITRWADNFAGRQSFKEGIIEWCPDFAKV